MNVTSIQLSELTHFGCRGRTNAKQAKKKRGMFSRVAVLVFISMLGKAHGNGSFDKRAPGARNWLIHLLLKYIFCSNTSLACLHLVRRQLRLHSVADAASRLLRDALCTYRLPMV